MIMETDNYDYIKQKYSQLNDYNETIMTERRALLASIDKFNFF